MDKSVKRITAVSRSGDVTEAVVIFRGPTIKRKVSGLSAPLEKVVRHLVNANAIGATEALQRYNRSSGKRRDGWLLDATRGCRI